MTQQRVLMAPNGTLSMRRQCALLAVTRSSVYYEPVVPDAEELALMRRIDELHLQHPFFGSRMITQTLKAEGPVINRKRVQRLMRLMGLESTAPQPTTSTPAPDHPVYPYLLRGLTIARPNPRDSVFTPLSLWMTRDDIVALLRRYSPRVHDPRLGSVHHQVRALIVCWARRWHLNAPWIRDEAWRTLSCWARWSGDSRPAGRVFGWAPLVDTTPRPIAPIEPCPPRIPPSAPLVSTTPRSIAPPTPKLLRPRDGEALIWLVRHRVWPTPASLEDLANGVTERGYVTPHAVRVAVNYLAHELDLPVRRRGRPRAARSRAPSPRA